MKKTAPPLAFFIIQAGLLFFLLPSIQAAEDKLPSRVDWEKTVEAAKKEGQLTLYGKFDIIHPDVIAAFNKEHPSIKVMTAVGLDAGISQRISAERRAGKYLVDVYSGGPNIPQLFYIAKFLEPIPPILVLPEVTDTSNWYGGRHHYADPENKYLFMFEGSVVATGLSYNTKFLDPNEIKSYWDLLNPKWRGKMTAWDERDSISTRAVITYHTQGLGPEFLRRFYTETDVTLFRSARQGTDWLGTGKFPLCFRCRYIDTAKLQGLPVESLPSQHFGEGGAIGGGSSSVLVLFNRPPHPNAAKVFINWFLSRQGQMAFQNIMNVKILDSADSMRIDIPKDIVLPQNRRVEGRKYQVIGYVDPKPVAKFLKEILK